MTAIRDVRPLGTVEADMRARGVCPWQVEYGNFEAPGYCGNPLPHGELFCGDHDEEMEDAS